MLKITKNQGSIQVTASESGFYPFDGTITFPTNSLFTATSANTDMITFKSTSNGDVQFVGNYKDITISGRSYDTKQKFLTAFSNLANQGSVDAYTKAETDAKIDAKQGKLKAGNGITLTEDATDGTTVVQTAVSLTDNGEGAYTIGDSIGIGDRASVRIGDNNNVLQGRNSIVIGDHAMTSSEKCIAIGNSSVVNAGSTCSIVIGDSASAYSKNSVAIGYLSDATNDTPLVINAGYKTVDDNDQPLTVLQSDSTGKLSILKGDGTDERMVIQDEIEALKNAGGSGGTVDAYTKTETDTKLEAKQDKLTAGSGITIDENNVISSTGGSGGGANPLVAVKGTDSATITDTVTDAVAIGSGASVEGEKAVAVGPSAAALADNTVAIGPGARAMISKPLVIKAGINVNGVPLPMIQGDTNGKISIPLGDGTSDTMCLQDEIAALKNAGGSGGGANPLVAVKGTNSAIISDNVTNAVAIGNDAKVSQENGVAVGSGTKAFGGKSVAVGYQTSSQGEFSVGIGSGATASGQYGIAVGYQASSLDDISVAIGPGATASAHKPMVINAGGKTMIQGDATGKISVLLGDGTDTRMVISDEITALKAEITTLKAEIAALKGGA